MQAAAKEECWAFGEAEAGSEVGDENVGVDVEVAEGEGEVEGAGATRSPLLVLAAAGAVGTAVEEGSCRRAFLPLLDGRLKDTRAFCAEHERSLRENRPSSLCPSIWRPKSDAWSRTSGMELPSVASCVPPIVAWVQAAGAYVPHVRPV